MLEAQTYKHTTGDGFDAPVVAATVSSRAMATADQMTELQRLQLRLLEVEEELRREQRKSTLCQQQLDELLYSSRQSAASAAAAAPAPGALSISSTGSSNSSGNTAGARSRQQPPAPAAATAAAKAVSASRASGSPVPGSCDVGDGDEDFVKISRQELELLRLKVRAMDALHEGLTIADCSLPDMPLIYANEGFARITGHTVHEAVGKNCRFLQRPPNAVPPATAPPPGPPAAAATAATATAAAPRVCIPAIDASDPSATSAIDSQAAASCSTGDNDSSAGATAGATATVPPPAEHDTRAIQELRAAIAAGRACVVQLLNYKKNGDAFVNYLSITPIYDTAGRLTHYVGIQSDITELVRRKQAELAARHEAVQAAAATEAKSQFLARMSHEIRTPLNGMIAVRCWEPR